MSGAAEDAACDSRTASVGIAPAKGAQRVASWSGGAGKQLSVNWNNVRKGKVRTALRRPASKPANSTNSFNKVNGEYWRSGSASEDESEAGTRAKDINALAKGGSDVDSDRSTDDSTDPSDVDDNDSSILLNMDQPNTENLQLDAHLEPQPEPQSISTNEEQPPMQPDTTSTIEIKEETIPVVIEPPAVKIENIDTAAQTAFSSKYSVPPRTIAELNAEDFKKQLKYLHYNSTGNPDPTTPVRCTDCFREGHLSDICPSKKCEHCGAWEAHESRFCPTWRRCQKCRERGHDKASCSAPLQGSAAEVPCDLCGSDRHIESQCDLMWKQPHPTHPSGKLFISISCAQCTSSQHLIGDCPSVGAPLHSTSWSLKAFDPSIISNTSLSSTNAPNGRANGAIPQLKIKGRAQREPTPEEHELHIRSRPHPPSAPRSNIRFAEGLGRGRNLSSNQSRSNDGGNDRYTPRDSHRDYRERDQYFGSNSRPRSRSPESRYGGNHHRPPLPPSRGRGPPPPSRNPGRDRGRGRGGSGGGQHGGKDSSRPMPGRGKRKGNRNS
ncbi:zinc knuckle domain-containing protein [Nannizzia gypsea CBS 118893]|uniref:Zinc knuckle domain-containing protein n=1 Tax=Arthroderma gypseum (strain ATCC MYA-4604 / CBS 118893) TaxID=535722 RepID=E5R2X6_ARTGP|nr:zinc knuckle domain-containing protein [Nannizzia gypsea CBS 118893]EFQ97897.1 zinc knuckle domain-containing protein [Nannizzia gypsea CBS 118893]